MKQVAKVPYDDMDFVYVENHYDIHLSGLCRYDGKIHRFLTNDDDFDDSHCIILELSYIEKLKALWDKKLFEICVGTHWTYHEGKRMGDYYIRKPAWLHKKLFKWFYGK